MEHPSRSQRLVHGDAPEPAVPASQGRQIYAVEHAAAVLLQGPEDERRAHAVGDPRLDHGVRLQEAARQVAAARQQGVDGPAGAKRVLAEYVFQQPARVLFDLAQRGLVENVGGAAESLLDVLERVIPAHSLVGWWRAGEEIQAEIRVPRHPVGELPWAPQGERREKAPAL